MPKRGADPEPRRGGQTGAESLELTVVLGMIGHIGVDQVAPHTDHVDTPVRLALAAASHSPAIGGGRSTA